MSLSPREQRLLAAIEEELGEQDPRLAAALAHTRPGTPARLPVRCSHAAALVAALALLVVVHVLGLEQGVLGTGVLTVALLVPWLVWTARSGPDERNER
ncbi:MAG TPA: DUF3040 domain-containing protein [Pseudonocardia sp.]|nr:DUF3040 domain-containing protein [Pseudonocardia sp.]